MAAMKSIVALLGLIATVSFAQTSGDFTLPAPAEPFSAPLAESVTAIAADALAAHIAVLASPSLEGRGLASRGYDAAVEYAAAQLKLAGVEPFGDTSTGYEQLVPVRRFANTRGHVEITRRDGLKIASRTFTAGVDVVIPEMAI